MQNGATLRRLQPISQVGDSEPFTIVPLFPAQGTLRTPEEVMASTVKWAVKAGYSVLSVNVPDEFAPYNAVIRVNAGGTEDQNRDYLAMITQDFQSEE